MWTCEWFLAIVGSLLISKILGHNWEILTMCMVSDEEMAKVLSQPEYSHLNGSTCQLTLVKTAYFLERAFVCGLPEVRLLRKPGRKHHRYKAYDLYAIASVSRLFVET